MTSTAPFGDAPAEALGRRILAGAVTVLVACVSLVGCATVAPRITGTYSAHIDSGESDNAIQVWQRAGFEGPVPWPSVGIARISWMVDGVDTGTSTCEEALVTLHPQEWVFTAKVPPDLILGWRGSTVDALVDAYPELRETDPTAGRVIGGTMFTAVMPNRAVDLMWQAPLSASPCELRVGVAVTCDEDLKAFAWLDNTTD